MVVKEATEEFFLEKYEEGTQKCVAFQTLALGKSKFETIEQLNELVAKFVSCPIDWAEAHWIGEDWGGAFTLSAEDIVAREGNDVSFRVATAAEKYAWQEDKQELYSRRVDVVLCDVTDDDLKALAEQGVEIW